MLDFISLIAGLVVLIQSANYMVAGTVSLSKKLGISAPELVASVVSARRGYTDIAVGNAVGSNIFNILWVVGITALFKELPFELVTNTDLVLVVGSSTLVLMAAATSKSNSILRWHGILFTQSLHKFVDFGLQKNLWVQK